MRSATTMSDNKDVSKRLYYYSTFDGYLDNRGENRNSRLSVTMLEKNSDYIYEVALTLEEADIGYILWRPALNRHDGYARKQQIRVQSKAHPKLTKIRKRIYIDNKKVIDPHMLTLLDAQALAIIFMADGSRKSCILASGKDNPLFRIHTNGFSYGDNWLLKKAIKERFDLEFNVERQATDKWGLYLRKKDNEKFESIISPFILESFRYKLER